MSTLISSATSGKKAAPKAPPRRRPAVPAAAPPPPPPRKVPTPVEETATEEQSTPTAIPPTPPAIQKAFARSNAGTQQVRFAEPVSDNGPPPSPRKAVEPPRVSAPAATSESTALTTGSSDEETPVVRDFAAREDQPQAQQQTPDPSQQQPPQYEQRQVPFPQAPAPTAVMIPGGQTESTRPAKRTRDESATPTRQRKAPKRSSVRSNTTAQTDVEDDGQPGPSTRRRAQSPPAPRRMRLSDQHAFVPSPAAEEDDEEEEEEEDMSPVPVKAPAKRKGKKIKTPARVQEDLDETTEQRTKERDQEETQEPPEPKPKRPRKPRLKRAPTAKSAEPVGGENEAELAAAEARAAAEGDADEEAAEEEPDFEMHEIDPNTLSMYKMTYQKRYGKTSAREKEMQTIDWGEVARKRREAAEIPTASKKEKQRQLQIAQSQHAENGVVQSTEDGAAGTPAAEGEPEPAETRGVDTGLGFRVVDGEIVMDEDTLTVDRRAQAQAAIAEETFVEEVNDLTVRHNRMTYMNDRRRFEEDRIPVWKAKSEAWDEENTDRFYEALRCWGTDFMIISRLFPGKNRAQIKKKFLREERLDPTRITASLLGKATTSSYSSTPLPAPRSMSLTDYATAANVPLSELNKFDGLEHAQALISEDMRDKEVAMQAAMEEEAENERQKRVQQEQRAKGAAEKERRKALSAAKKAARAKGQVWGAGTFGGIGGGDDDAAGGAE